LRVAGAVLRVTTSALGAIVVVTVAPLLLAILGSGVREMLCAVLLMVPLAGAVKPIVLVTVLALLRAIVGKVTIPVAAL
jgi:hypothetical protein